VDLASAEVIMFSSPFLACIETASAIAKQLNCKTINVQDALADTMMKNWFKEDPFSGISLKLTNNKE
jgi:broad specificity phosphatase PhoE